MSKKPIWREVHRPTRVEFRCQDQRDVYLSFDFNGVLAWEWVGQAGGRSGRAFAQYLRRVADRIERLPDNAPPAQE